MKKQYIEVPLPMTCSLAWKLCRGLAAILLLPVYLVMAGIARGPGLRLYLRCVFMGLRLLLAGRAAFKTCWHLIVFPIDSTRYFELSTVLARVRQLPCQHFLDVSSPRLLPLLLLGSAPVATAVLLNPDVDDLRETESLAKALRLTPRFQLLNATIDQAGFAPDAFDLITCVSVLEHIPEDRQAVAKMWSWLRPGGHMMLTLPCMAHPQASYISHNQYGILVPGNDGYTFWQHYYTPERLTAAIFSVTGAPVFSAVFGERQRGLFFRNATTKRLFGPLYPFWREPYMVAVEYSAFAEVEVLPGEGVIVLDFFKPKGGS